jgi:FixJ family two-component response regulator
MKAPPSKTNVPHEVGADVSTPPGDARPVVFVVDDDPSMRATLSDVMRSVGLEVQTFQSTREFLSSKLPDAPGCLVLDVRLPGQSGLDFQLTLAESGNELPVVFITGHGDVSMSVRAMKAGAVDFLTKPFRDQDLLDAVRVAIERDRERRKHAMHVADLHERYRSLTERERDIMALIVLGHANKQVAAALGLVELRVKGDRRQIMRKMGARSLLELVRMADRLGGPAKKTPRRLRTA